MPPETAAVIIARLGLKPHPEGGWYRETWREPAAPGARASATAIHFLLVQGQRSHWRRVDAAELWLWQAAEPVGGWVLVSCVVSPGFEFAGFELAPKGWSPGQSTV